MPCRFPADSHSHSLFGSLALKGLACCTEGRALAAGMLCSPSRAVKIGWVSVIALAVRSAQTPLITGFATSEKYRKTDRKKEVCCSANRANRLWRWLPTAGVLQI